MMEKRKLYVRMLLTMVLVAVSLLALSACNRQAEEIPTTEAAPLPDYKLYWNVDKDAFGGDTGPRKAEPDGSYILRLFADGQFTECRVPDSATVSKIDRSYLTALTLDENQTVTKVWDLNALPVEILSDEFYVQSVEGSVVLVNSSYRFDGMEASFTLSDATGIYDMTGVSGEPGTSTHLQENDRVIAVGSNGVADAVYVFGREGINSRITRYCEQCKQEVSWSNWYHEDNLPVATGHYYLVTDVTLTGQKSIPENETICLDLNGHTVTGAENARIYSLHYEGVTLSLFDYSDTQSGKLVAWGETCPQGACVWVRFGSFNLYGGTLDGSGAVSNVNGVTVAVPKNAVMHMFGGTVIGGKTTYAFNKQTGAAINSMGGAVSVAGTLNMYGGTIRDGYASCYRNEQKNSYSQGYGGNVLVAGGSFTMHDGIIENGIAEGGGGNVYVTSKGAFHMKGGTLSGGKTLMKGKNGGNLVIGSNCEFTLSGGTITGGISHNYGGNIHMLGTMTMTGGIITDGKVLDIQTGIAKEDHTAKNLFLVNGSMTMSGGEITGYMNVTDSKQYDGVKPYLCVSDTARITGAQPGHTNLFLNTGNDGYSLDVTILSEGAKIGVSASGKFTNKTSYANVGYFTSDIGAQIIHVGGCLFVGRWGCLCGGGSEHIGECDGSLHAWKAWGSATSLPTADGYYYLTKDVCCNQSGIQSGAHVYLDLNGKTVSAKGTSRIYATFQENSHLTITDSGKTGKLVTAVQDGQQGLGVWVRYGSFTLYGGTIDASQATGILNGVAIRVDGNTSFTMYGGTVMGGTAKVNDKGANGSGGSVHVKGTFSMHGGTVCGGRSHGHGGNICVDSGGVFRMSGGTLTGGMNLESGKSGGNVYIVGGGTMELSGGIVSDGMTRNIGGNIYGAGVLNMSGGTVTGGLRYQTAEDGTVTTSTFAGGNVQLVSGQLTMSGGLIEGYATVTSYNDKPASVTVSGNARIIGGENSLDLSLVAQGTATEPPVVNIEGILADDALIGLVYTGFFSGPTTKDNGDNFVVRGQLEIGHYDGRLAAGIRYHCACGAAGEEHKPGCDREQKVWNAWVSQTTLPSSEGYWFLMQDVTGCGQTNIQENAHVFLDLNGKTVTGKAGSRIYATFYEGACLTVTDSSIEQTGALIGSGESADQGKVVWVRYGSFTLYGGTLDASRVITTSNGAAVYLPGGTEFTMNGGTIISGTAALGGGIYSAGAVTVNGGLITRGHGNTGSALVHTTGANASFTVTGGVIDGASEAGNGLQTAAVTATGGCVVTMKGGSILGKPCGLYLYSSTLEMEAGTIGGAHVYVNGGVNSGSTANIRGGTLESGIYYYRGSGAVSGAPDISGGFGLKLAEGKTFTLGDLTEGAQILITCEDGGRIIAPDVADPTDLQYLQCAVKDQSLSYTDNGLYLSKGKFGCKVCGGVYDGCEHSEMVEWTPLGGDLSVINQSGNYYLTQDITLKGQLSVAKNARITLDLNGYCLSANGRVLALNNPSHLTVTDSAGSGRIQSTTNTRDNGMLLNINHADAVVTLYAGILDGSGITNANNGGAVNVAGTFRMYGGTVVGGQAANGGAVRVVGSGVMEMYDGLIYGGTASALGDNIYLAGSKTSTFAGGQIAGGVHYASGGLKASGDVVIDRMLTEQLGETLSIPGYSLRLNGNKQVDAGLGLAEGAKICITLSGTNNIIATNVLDAAQGAYFFLDGSECDRTYDPTAKTLTLTEQD